MSLSANRREVIAGAGAAAVAAPLLRPAAASAKNGDLRVSWLPLILAPKLIHDVISRLTFFSLENSFRLEIAELRIVLR
jgi:hypothetical protein